MAASIVPRVLEPWVQILVPQPCFDNFFIDINLLNVACLKVVLSKCLGFGVILGSILVKIPQILKIMKANSAEGISFAGVLLDLTAISATAAYGFANKFPFSAYGEALFMVLQTALIAFLVLYFTNKIPQAVAFIGIYCGIMGYLMSPLAPHSLLALIQTCNIFIVFASKFVQALANFRNGGTGQLSAITVTMLFLGSVARIFTSAQETGDLLIVITYLVSSSCNGVILAQIVYYWNVPTKQKSL